MRKFYNVSYWKYYPHFEAKKNRDNAFEFVEDIKCLTKTFYRSQVFFYFAETEYNMK